MSQYLYRNNQMEQDLLTRINDEADKRYNGDIPSEARERIAEETQHISENGYGTRLAIAAALAEYSAACGYHVGIRGFIGNLLTAHLLGIAALDPLRLGLPWEGCLGLDGTLMQEITLNVAPGLLNGLRAHLWELLPDCDVLFGPGVPRWKTIIVPRESGAYNPDNEYLSITLCPHELIGRAGKVLSRTFDVDDFGKGLIASTYRTDMYDIPVLGDLDDFQDLASLLEPETFSDLVKVMGLCLAWKVQFQAYSTPLLPDRFDNLVGTREDIYDICVKHGIGVDDAFQIMQQSVRGNLTQGYKDMLAAQGLPGMFLKTLDAGEYLYPRGQCADYMYWVLTILSREQHPCRV